jgi:hypothetical protein
MDCRVTSTLLAAVDYAARLPAPRAVALAAVDLLANDEDLAAVRAEDCNVISFPILVGSQLIRI